MSTGEFKPREFVSIIPRALGEQETVMRGIENSEGDDTSRLGELLQIKSQRPLKKEGLDSQSDTI